MIFKKAITTLCAAAFAASAVMPIMASAAVETPEADADGVYCQAGIVFQIRDQWDHRNEIKLEPFDETETTVLDISFKDVNITGNGEYTVEMSGYLPEYIDDIAGFLAVELDIDFTKYSNVEDGVATEGVNFQVNKAVIDGVEYTFNTGLGDDEKPYQPLENGEKFENNQQIIKIKNGWGELHADMCTPEMPKEVWTTADPMSITFTVSGLPTDKIEGFENEVVERVYGNGTNVGAEEEESSEVVEESSAAESEAADSTAETASSEAASEADSSSSSDSSDSDGISVGLIAGIAAGAVVIIAIIAVIIKKK